MSHILWLKTITRPFTSQFPQLSPAPASMGDFSTSRRPHSAKVCVKLRSASCPTTNARSKGSEAQLSQLLWGPSTLQGFWCGGFRKVGFSTLNQPFWGTHISGNLHVNISGFQLAVFPPPARPAGSPASSSNSYPGWRPSRPGRRSGTAPHQLPGSSRRGPPWCDEKCGHSLWLKRWQGGQHQNSGNTRLTKQRGCGVRPTRMEWGQRKSEKKTSTNRSV